MVLHESYKGKIKSIVVADPCPEIQEHGNPDTSVLLLQYIQKKDGWIFPKMEKYTAKDLYPYPYEPKEGLWDDWKPE